MRTGTLILSVALLSFSLVAAAQAPDGNYRRGTLPAPRFPQDAKPSLISGHLKTALPIGSFPCPESHICLDSVWDDTFADMKTQLGPVIEPRAHVRSVHDAGVAGDPIVAYIVKADTGGQLWAVDLRVVHNGSACFDRQWADEWPELRSQPRTTHSGDEICFRLK